MRNEDAEEDSKDKLPVLIIMIGMTLLLPLTATNEASATDILGIPHQGYVGELAIPSRDGYALSMDIVGTASFDLLVVSNESKADYFSNISYDYVHALTRFNVTTLSVAGELPPGYYHIMIIAHAAGNFTLDYHYGPPNPLTNPWVLFGILAAT